MATYSRKLKDADGNYIAPATRSSCVYMENDEVFSLLTFFPVGAIFQSISDSSPASLFGGEWEKLENTFLYGSGTKKVGTTGGEEYHTLSVNELASHYHPLSSQFRLAGVYGQNSNSPLWNRGQSYKNDGAPYFELDWTNVEATTYTGGNQAHNNMPPYTVINIWKRVA